MDDDETFGPTVRLLNGADLLAQLMRCDLAARTCTQGLPEEGAHTMPATRPLKALDVALRAGHESVVEHCTLTFAIRNLSRVASHQLVRHRVASYCVSGDTKIRTSSQKTNNRTIRELYGMTPQYFNMILLRCVDESNGNIRYNHPEEIVYAGVKPTYTVKTIHGYEIRTTKEHQFLTEKGWKTLEDISVGEKVYINGQDSYKDRDWMYEMYHVQNMTQQEIADMCGVSNHWIKVWVRRLGLQKEPGSWARGVAPPNKGKTKENYEPMRRTSEKMMGNHNPAMFRKGPEKIGSWKGDNITEGGYRARTARMMYPKRTGVCELCGFRGVTEFHHMNKNYTEYDTNLMELCVSCHKAIHRKEITQRIVLSEIVSVEYYGEEDTYDVVMPYPYHNFIADGFVVHNSQQSLRYSAAGGEFYTPVSFREASDDVYDEYLSMLDASEKIYRRFIEAGIPEEDARYVLPMAVCSDMIVTMNLREFIHLCGLRRCRRAQEEIRMLADAMAAEVIEAAPFLRWHIGPQCERLGYCPEARGCGNYPRREMKVDTMPDNHAECPQVTHRDGEWRWDE